jgi:hypothetical protein
MSIVSRAGKRARVRPLFTRDASNVFNVLCCRRSSVAIAYVTKLICTASPTQTICS